MRGILVCEADLAEPERCQAGTGSEVCAVRIHASGDVECGGVDNVVRPGKAVECDIGDVGSTAWLCMHKYRGRTNTTDGKMIECLDKGS